MVDENCTSILSKYGHRKMNIIIEMVQIGNCQPLIILLGETNFGSDAIFS